MELECDKVERIEVAYDNLEKFVKFHIPAQKDYSFVRSEECSNVSDHTFYVDGKLEDYDQDDLEEVLAGGTTLYRNSLILNYLAQEELIEKGLYLVNVSW